MIRHMLSLGLFALAATSAAMAAPAAKPRVALQTSMGRIVIELEAKRAPITSANFLHYVDQKKFDGTKFYRAARSGGGTGFIQGGIFHEYRRMLVPIAHEPTNVTGIKHINGTISMARDAPGTANGDFFITIGTQSYMDAHPGQPGDNKGFAAFGHVVGGMDVVRMILAAHTVKGSGTEGMRDQMIGKPIVITSATRVN